MKTTFPDNQTNQKDYTLLGQTHQLVLPLNIDILIPADDSVRLLSQQLEELDYTELLARYSPKGRNPEVLPITMFKILVYAYMNQIFSARKIASACKRDINFMWLLAGQPAPNYTAISRFRSQRLAPVIESLFYQYIALLDQMGEIEFKHFFIDGTKIEANANRYSFVWKKSTEKNEAKMHEKIKEFLIQLNEEMDKTYTFVQAEKLVSYLEEIKGTLLERKESQGICFVYGTGKRKTKLQKQIEQIEEFIQRQEKYNQQKKICGERNSYSKTDHDASFMRMKEDHMKNGQLKPGYNVQIAVEGEYIVGADISSRPGDQLTLIPFINKLTEKTSKKPEQIIADSGYESEENYLFLEDKGIKCFIKPADYEQKKKKGYKLAIGKRENMIYDQENDEYICHNQKRLKYIGDTKRKSKNTAYTASISNYQCEDCQGCPIKAKCTTAKENKKVSYSKLFVEKRNQSLANISSNKGILLRMNRSIQVEGAFGVLKQDYEFRRFSLRGHGKVEAEFLILSLAYNINKLHNKIQNNRCKSTLHKKKIA